MPETLENYIPQSVAGALKKQARTVWGTFLFIVFVWVVGIVLAPLAASNGFENISAPIYKFFSYLCHQQSERSFHFDEHPLAVCSRCCGVYFGLFAGFLGYPFLRNLAGVEPLPRFWLFLAMIPIGVDWSLGVFGLWENTHWSRLATGFILGAACAVYIVPALVEIFRFRSRKRPSR